MTSNLNDYLQCLRENTHTAENVDLDKRDEYTKWAHSIRTRAEVLRQTADLNDFLKKDGKSTAAIHYKMVSPPKIYKRGRNLVIDQLLNKNTTAYESSHTYIYGKDEDKSTEKKKKSRKSSSRNKVSVAKGLDEMEELGDTTNGRLLTSIHKTPNYFHESTIYRGQSEQPANMKSKFSNEK